MLNQTIRKELFQHMHSQAKKKGIHLDTINGYNDHVHCLISLNHNQTLSEIAQLLKGESAHWINLLELIDGQFKWQEEYFAVSVAESVVVKVRQYIQRQEEHHKHKTFEDECVQLAEKYGFKINLTSNFPPAKLEAIDITSQLHQKSATAHQLPRVSTRG